MSKKIQQDSLFNEIKILPVNARQKVLRSVNTTMVETYFQIGKMIVEDEEGGKVRVNYGEETLMNLSKELTNEFGNGFSVRNLKLIRQFFLSYPIRQTLSAEFKLF